MHNIDRTVGESNYEYNQESYEHNPETYEYSGEYQGEYQHEDEFLNELHELEQESYEYSGEAGYETESGLPGESHEMELATELLTVSNEEELEQFLGKIIGGVKKFARSSAGRAIGGILKSAARKALPIVGGAVGGMLGPAGSAIGSRLGSWASTLFELELEGMSNEDKEYEIARAYVRFAKDAVRRAASNPAHVRYPRQVARDAVVGAARRHAPGLLRRLPGVIEGGSGNHGTQPGTSGTWHREGNQIIINL